MSQAFAKIIKTFSEKYDWAVIAITMDGLTVPEFLSAKHDNGMSDTLAIKSVPAVFIANPSKEQLVPVGYGAIGLDKLEDNVLMQFAAEEMGEKT